METQTLHRVSDHLCDRWPILPEERENGSRVVSVAYGRRGVSKLAELLASGSLDVAETALALRLLYDLLSSAENCVLAVEDGLVRVSLSLLGTRTNAEELRARAAALLERMLATGDGRRELVKIDGLSRLSTSISSDESATVRHGAARALQQVCRFADGRAAMRAATSALTAAVCAWSMTPSVMHAFQELTCEPVSTGPLLSAGIVGAAAKLLKDADTADATVVRATLATMRSILHDDGGKALALAAGMVPSLLRLCTHTGQHERVTSTGCIATLSVPGDGKRALLACGDAFTSTIVACLHDAHPSVVDSAQIVCHNVAEIPTGRRTVVRCLLADPGSFRSVFGANAPTMQEAVHVLRDGPDTLAAATLQAFLSLVVSGPADSSEVLRGCLHARTALNALAQGSLPPGATWTGTVTAAMRENANAVLAVM